MRSIVFIGLLVLSSCKGFHNPKIEDAGEMYKDTKRHDSIVRELEQMQRQTLTTDEDKVTSILISNGWYLTSIRDKTNKNLKIEKPPLELIKFTQDSIFIITEKKKFTGTWRYDPLSLNIKIPGTNRFNYSVGNITDNNELCLSLIGSSVLKCFISTTSK